MFCMEFYHFDTILTYFYWLLLLESVLGFPALVSRILWKPVILLLSRFNWLVATWWGIYAWGVSKQITNSFTHGYMCVYMFVYVCVCLYVWAYKCLYMCICIYIYIYIYMYMYVYMYIYIYYCLTFKLLLCSSFAWILEQFSLYMVFINFNKSFNSYIRNNLI